MQASRRSGRQVQRQLSRFQTDPADLYQQFLSDSSQLAEAEGTQGSASQGSMLAAWQSSQIAILAEHVSSSAVTSL